MLMLCYIVPPVTGVIPPVIAPVKGFLMPYYSAPVTGVIDPSSNEEVSMQKAVMLGMVNSAMLYCPPVTGVTLLSNAILFCTCYRCTDIYIYTI